MKFLVMVINTFRHRHQLANFAILIDIFFLLLLGAVSLVVELEAIKDRNRVLGAKGDIGALGTFLLVPFPPDTRLTCCI